MKDEYKVFLVFDVIVSVPILIYLIEAVRKIFRNPISFWRGLLFLVSMIVSSSLVIGATWIAVNYDVFILTGVLRFIFSIFPGIIIAFTLGFFIYMWLDGFIFTKWRSRNSLSSKK